MGLTKIRATVGKGKKALTLGFLVDSGASFTVLPEGVWKELRLKPLEEMTFTLADATIITRKISEVWFEYSGRGRTIQVILGENKDVALLGAFTMEALGLMLNPFNRELVPMKMMLAKFSAAK